KDATPLKEGDTISIVPSIAGGSFSLMDRLGAKRKDALMPAEIKRYSRHLILPEVGMAGQLKLKQSSALIIGAGGLGVPLTQYLGVPGARRPGVVDFDVLDQTHPRRPASFRRARRAACLACSRALSDRSRRSRRSNFSSGGATRSSVVSSSSTHCG